MSRPAGFTLQFLRPMIRLLFGALLASQASARATGEGTEAIHLQVAPGVPASQAEYTLGEIKSIDPDRGAVTVKHAAIRHLGMPDMTMRFRLADPGRAVTLRTGDLVRFRAEKRDGTLVITDVVRR